MPSCARTTVVDQDEVGVYHVWGRCVRRAWLCGDDPLSGNNYDYRRDWICQNEQAFAALFGCHVKIGESRFPLLLQRGRDETVRWVNFLIATFGKIRGVLSALQALRMERFQLRSPGYFIFDNLQA